MLEDPPPHNGQPVQGARTSASKVPTAFPASRPHTRLVFIGFYQVFRSFRIPETFSKTAFLG